MQPIVGAIASEPVETGRAETSKPTLEKETWFGQVFSGSLAEAEADDVSNAIFPEATQEKPTEEGELTELSVDVGEQPLPEKELKGIASFTLSDRTAPVDMTSPKEEVALSEAPEYVPTPSVPEPGTPAEVKPNLTLLDEDGDLRESAISLPTGLAGGAETASLNLAPIKEEIQEKLPPTPSLGLDKREAKPQEGHENPVASRLKSGSAVGFPDDDPDIRLRQADLSNTTQPTENSPQKITQSTVLSEGPPRHLGVIAGEVQSGRGSKREASEVLEPRLGLERSENNLYRATDKSFEWVSQSALQTRNAVPQPRGYDRLQDIRGDQSSLPDISLSVQDSEEVDRLERPTSLRPEMVTRPVIQQISIGVTRLTQDGTVDVKLWPEELGKVRLALSPSDVGLVVQIAAERPETLDLIRRNIDLLEADLREQGFEGLAFEFDANHRNQGSHDQQAREQSTPILLSSENTELELSENFDRTTFKDRRIDIRL